MTPRHLTRWADAGIGEQQHDPIADFAVLGLLHKIAQANGDTYAGCWDAVVWLGESVLFAELKRHKKDRIQPTQPRWSEASLQAGLQPANFLSVEWDFIKHGI